MQYSQQGYASKDQGEHSIPHDNPYQYSHGRGESSPGVSINQDLRTVDRPQSAMGRRFNLRGRFTPPAKPENRA